MMDDLFAKLRQGDGLGRKAQRRARKAHGDRLGAGSSSALGSLASGAGDPSQGGSSSANTSATSPPRLEVDPAMAAKGMLLQLKGDGFDIDLPASPRVEKERRTIRPIAGLMPSMMEESEGLQVPASNSFAESLTSGSEYAVSDAEPELGPESRPRKDEPNDGDGDDHDEPNADDDDATQRMPTSMRRQSSLLPEMQTRPEDTREDDEPHNKADSSFVLDDLNEDEAVAAGLA